MISSKNVIRKIILVTIGFLFLMQTSCSENEKFKSDIVNPKTDMNPNSNATSKDSSTANYMLAQPSRVLNIRTPGKCYSQDFGTVYREKGFDRWLLYYGAVSDLAKPRVHSCHNPGYSEDIWVTWDTKDGFNFQKESVLLLTSQDLADAIGKGPGADPACKECSGWMVGDPAVVRGNSKKWYLFFDGQSCLDAQNKTWTGIFVATSDSPFRGWSITPTGPQGLALPVTPTTGTKKITPAWPRIFKDPTNGKIYLYYNDQKLKIRVVEIADNGDGGIWKYTEVGSTPVTKQGVADTLSVFYANGKYWAVTDDFAKTKSVHLLGPSPTPFYFDWETRREILKAKDWYSEKIMGVSSIGPDHTDDKKPRVYFWGHSSGNSCVEDGQESAGASILDMDLATFSSSSSVAAP